MNRSELLKKYNVPGPRYTSYPTVPYWENTPSETEWVQSLGRAFQKAADSKTGAAAYIHIPFCESLCTYCGCNTRITRNRKVVEPYFEAVLKEAELYRQKLKFEKLPLTDLHLGGGTPTFPTARELENFLSRFLDGFEISTQPEFSVEVDPRVTTTEHLKTLYHFGFKRISLGVQDFNSKVQEIVHRVQSYEQVQTLTEEARKLGYTSVNYDLIYGLPLQTRDSIRETIEKVIRLRPDRIAFYGYAHVPWIKPSQRRYTESDLPDGNEKRVLYEIGRMMLEEASYREIGMDHFSLTDDSLWKATQDGTLHRNFMGYVSNDVFPLLGLGVSAIGDSWEIFLQNEKLLEKYYARLEKEEIPILRGHLLNSEDQIIRRHILNLMTRFSTSWEDTREFTPFLSGLEQKLNEPLRDGLVKISDSRIEITDEGRPFLRNICMAFDARLSRRAPDTLLFSKTI